MKKAIHYFTLAPNKNDPEAQFILGEIYCNGDIAHKIIYIKKRKYYRIVTNRFEFLEIFEIHDHLTDDCFLHCFLSKIFESNIES